MAEFSDISLAGSLSPSISSSLLQPLDFGTLLLQSIPEIQTLSSQLASFSPDFSFAEYLALPTAQPLPDFSSYLDLGTQTQAPGFFQAPALPPTSGGGYLGFITPGAEPLYRTGGFQPSSETRTSIPLLERLSPSYQESILSPSEIPSLGTFSVPQQKVTAEGITGEYKLPQTSFIPFPILAGDYIPASYAGDFGTLGFTEIGEGLGRNLALAPYKLAGDTAYPSVAPEKIPDFTSFLQGLGKGPTTQPFQDILSTLATQFGLTSFPVVGPGNIGLGEPIGLLGEAGNIRADVVEALKTGAQHPELAGGVNLGSVTLDQMLINPIKLALGAPLETSNYTEQIRRAISSGASPVEVSQALLESLSGKKADPNFILANFIPAVDATGRQEILAEAQKMQLDQLQKIALTLGRTDERLPAEFAPGSPLRQKYSAEQILRTLGYYFEPVAGSTVAPSTGITAPTTTTQVAPELASIYTSGRFGTYNQRAQDTAILQSGGTSGLSAETQEALKFFPVDQILSYLTGGQVTAPTPTPAPTAPTSPVPGPTVAPTGDLVAILNGSQGGGAIQQDQLQAIASGNFASYQAQQALKVATPEQVQSAAQAMLGGATIPAALAGQQPPPPPPATQDLNTILSFGTLQPDQLNMIANGDFRPYEAQAALASGADPSSLVDTAKATLSTLATGLASSISQAVNIVGGLVGSFTSEAIAADGALVGLTPSQIESLVSSGEKLSDVEKQQRAEGIYSQLLQTHALGLNGLKLYNLQKSGVYSDSIKRGSAYAHTLDRFRDESGTSQVPEATPEELGILRSIAPAPKNPIPQALAIPTIKLGMRSSVKQFSELPLESQIALVQLGDLTIGQQEKVMYEILRGDTAVAFNYQ